MISSQNSTKPNNNAFVNELRLLASKSIKNPNERETFVTTFQLVNLKKKNFFINKIFVVLGNEGYC